MLSVIILLVVYMSKTPRIKTFENENFEAAYRKFALPLMKFLLKKMGGDYSAAEEVFAETVASAWHGWHTFKNKSSYFTWLCRIALNKTADYYRSQVNKNSFVVAPVLEKIAQVGTTDLSFEEKLALDELRASVRICFNLLPPNKQQLLYLRYWENLTLKKIARLLGVSEKAIEGRLYRAKLAFKKVYQAHLLDTLEVD